MVATYNDINKVKKFNRSTKIEVVEQFMEEVEQLDIKNLLGNRFYVDVINNLSNYDDIIYPLTYEYGGYTYQHNGLVYVISYLTHSLYVENHKLKDTDGGIVVPNSEYSNQIDYATSKNLSKRYRNLAMTEFDNIKRYLCYFPNKFDLYCGNDTLKSSRPRIRKAF